MPEFPLPQNAARGLALARASESMLRTMGGGEVVFRLPASIAAVNPIKRELGLEPAITEDVAVSPVLVQRSGNRFEVLVSPKSLESHLHVRGQTAEGFLNATTSLLASGRTLRIESYGAEVFAGRAYLYRISATE